MKQDLGIETELVVGKSGEFTIWVDGKIVLEKKSWRFPEPAEVVAAVRSATPVTQSSDGTSST